MAAKEFGDGMDYHVHLQGKWAQKRRGEKYIVRHDRGSGHMPHCDDFPYINHIEARVAEWLEVYDIRRTREHVLQHLGVARVDLNCLYTETSALLPEEMYRSSCTLNCGRRPGLRSGAESAEPG